MGGAEKFQLPVYLRKLGDDPQYAGLQRAVDRDGSAFVRDLRHHDERADQKVSGGFGIMLDDLIAGLWAALCIFLIQFILHF